MTVTLDTSVVVPALDASHEAHEPVVSYLERVGEVRLVAHVALEAYHALTRVRPYRRLPPQAVASSLRSSFPGPLVGLPPEDYWDLAERAPKLGIVGGAIFDALIATAARRADLRLLSRDRRAATIYATVGVECDLISP
jgi:predicted nucleic acid-binding protein